MNNNHPGRLGSGHNRCVPGRTGAAVLVVEDDPGVRTLLMQLLTYSGYVAECVRGGEEALALIEERRQGGVWWPDLVVLDLMMPGMNGIEFAREYRRRQGPRAPIVLVSATMELNEARRAIEPAAVLRKPFELVELLESIESALRRSGTHEPL